MKNIILLLALFCIPAKAEVGVNFYPNGITKSVSDGRYVLKAGDTGMTGNFVTTGDITANSFIGSGVGLTGLPGGGDAVLAATQTWTGSNTMSGPLTLAGSSLTVRGNGLFTAAEPIVNITATGGANNGAWLGLISPVSNWSWVTNRNDLMGAADSMGLYNGGGTAGTTRVRAVFTPTGLTLPDSLAITGSAFSVGGSTFVVAGGKVGVGTSIPNAKLDVNGDIAITKGSDGLVHTYDANNLLLRAAAATSTVGKAVKLQYLEAGVAWHDAFRAENVASGYSNALIMPDGGNVGIGNTNPSTKLHLSSGTLTVDGLNGFVDFGRVIVSSATATSARSLIATCPTGKYIASGGYAAGATGKIVITNAPANSTSWAVEWWDAAPTASWTAYAICDRGITTGP
jgi:hypothetical protein